MPLKTQQNLVKQLQINYTESISFYANNNQVDNITDLKILFRMGKFYEKFQNTCAEYIHTPKKEEKTLSFC